MATMPKNDGEALEQRGIALTPSQWAELESMLAHEGRGNMRELLRELVLLGLTEKKRQSISAIEFENKQLINRRLKVKEMGAVEALLALEGKSDDPEVKAAIAKIKNFLATQT